MGDVHRTAEALQHVHGDFLVDRVVLGQQDMRGEGRGAAPCRAGRVCGRRGGSGRQCVRQALVQVGLADRLYQVGGETGLFGDGGLVLEQGGRHHDQRHLRQHGVGLDALAQLEAVHAGHFHVDDHQVVGGRAAVGGMPEQVQRRQGAGHGIDGHAPGQGVALQDVAVGVVVLDDQQPLPRQCGSRQDLVGLRVVREGQGQGESEGGALPDAGLDPDLALHDFDQLLGNDQPQAGAAEPPGGGAVGLGEGLEQAGQGFFADADAGVADVEADAGQGGAGLGTLPRRLVQADVDHDFAVAGKLDGVADQVAEDLADADGVAVDGFRHVGRDAATQFQVLAVRPLGEQLDDVLDGLVQVEVQAFQLETPGLDLGKVQDVVDDGQQGLAGTVHGGRKPALGVGQVGVEQQLGHAQHPVHGGADLVAHVGEELGLGGVGGLGQLLRQAQLRSPHLYLALKACAVL